MLINTFHIAGLQRNFSGMFRCIREIGLPSSTKVIPVSWWDPKSDSELLLKWEKDLGYYSMLYVGQDGRCRPWRGNDASTICSGYGCLTTFIEKHLAHGYVVKREDSSALLETINQFIGG